ncbi:MAG: hypothetical protein H6709_12375 [Kofleriaceae bacterium]|nr:hypothetical protein [Myxococcales bacterium]MCB9563633.1 hypothetical protein [Kofleriaceae bacterium]MCB9572874.1 hypothetical protein [Kofleriaceae bacterium]
MRSLTLAAVVALATPLAAACDDMGGASGARGACLTGGQLLGCEDEIVTAEDACWKLVGCGVIPVDNQDPNGRDWGRCVGRIGGYDEDAQQIVIACVATASCDLLTVNDSPVNPYEWPDCLELGGQ